MRQEYHRSKAFITDHIGYIFEHRHGIISFIDG